jgi:cholesterol transport system auxiliary component
MNVSLPRRTLVALACGVAAVLAASCGASLLPKPPQAPARFTLDDGAAAGAQRPPLPGGAVLVVEMPRAGPGFDSARMVYLRQPQQLQSFAFHEWVDTPAHMLAPLLVRALQASGSFRAVLRAPSAAGGALRLETELIRLQQDFGSTPSHVRLTLRAMLMDGATRRPIAWREFDVSVPAASDDPAGGVAAAREATRQVLGELAEFADGLAAARGALLT